jgi:hypothetical protein
MEQASYSVVMAIFDFVPVVGFLIGAYFLSKIFFHTSQKGFSRMMIIGGLLIFLGGSLQATWKLMMSLEIADVQWMSQGQFVFMSFGYMALLIPTFSLIKSARKLELTPLPAMAVWKIPFLFVMTVASLGTYGILTYVSLRRKLGLAAFGFIIAFLGVIMMGGMASQTQTITMQWIEQGINSLANLGFALGSFLLYQNFTRHEQLFLKE